MQHMHGTAVTTLFDVLLSALARAVCCMSQRIKLNTCYRHDHVFELEVHLFTDVELYMSFLQCELSVCEQAYVMILAGQETTANALAFTLYLIAAHKAVEARITAEINAFGRGRTPTYDDIERCVDCLHHIAEHERADVQ